MSADRGSLTSHTQIVCPRKEVETMKRFVLLMLVVAAVAPVAAFAANTDATTNASTDCTALKAKMGATAFAQAYSSFGACVSRYAQIEQQNQTSANTSCTALAADAGFAATHGGKTFVQFYGTGKSGSNAMGRCISSIAKTSSQVEQQGRLNPAQTCRALKVRVGASAFVHLYGTTANDKNAFGKCVSKTAQVQSQNELKASAACQSEQNADTQAFALKYGTNDDKSNAFGKCVSTR
jgi:hypothetical protein